MTSNTAPTVVLVHGAFADSSGWNEVVRRLRADGVAVQAVANPLRGIANDSAYVASALRQVSGPVLAVGHSYGGAIITNAATLADNVVGLVYVAAFAPDEGEALQEIEGDSACGETCWSVMVPPAGFEPATAALGESSSPLSYALASGFSGASV